MRELELIAAQEKEDDGTTSRDICLGGSVLQLGPVFWRCELGGGNMWKLKYVFFVIFTPENWGEDEPILMSIYVSKGLIQPMALPETSQAGTLQNLQMASEKDRTK